MFAAGVASDCISATSPTGVAFDLSVAGRKIAVEAWIATDTGANPYALLCLYIVG